MTIAFIDTIAEVRRFNRFYTQKIGVLEENVYHVALSLSEARILYELANRKAVTASELAAALGLDQGYVSRILTRFEKQKLLKRSTRSDDRRKNVLTLTHRGSQTFARIDRASNEQTGAMLRGLAEGDRKRVVAAMQTIASALGASSRRGEPYILRPPAPGDYGWVVERHGAIYAAEYGWNEEFEALVAEIMVNFIRRFDPHRDRAWIAERDGQNAGCVFLVKKSERVAQLRCLLVEPNARGLGIGARLVEECIRFAQQRGYKKVILWTNDILHAARHIYEQRGFKRVEERRHHSFGHDLIGQTWQLSLEGQ